MTVYGWRNYYKRDSSYRRDNCPKCRHIVFLHSFTTTRCFHLYLVPLFPLGRKRILNQCPACSAGREFSFRDWKRLRTGEVEPALERVRIDPAVRENAEKALSLVTQFGSKGEFVELAGMLADHYQNDAAMMATLGWVYHYFDMPVEGNNAFQQSLRIQDNAEIRKAFEYRASLQAASPPVPPGRVRQAVPLLIAPALLTIVLLAFLFSGFTGQPERVYLVNGLNEPYKVLVNGVVTPVNALERVPLKVDYGKVRIEPVDGGLPFDPVTGSVRFSFLRKKGDDPVVVINPDKAAVILREDAVYFSEDKSGSDPGNLENRYRIFVGHGFYIFEQVDAAFEDLPGRVELSTSASRTRRSGIKQINAFSAADTVSMLLKNNRRIEAIAFARSTLKLQPGDDRLLALLASVWEPAEMIAFLKTGLSHRPVLVEWHRYYQQLAGKAEPDRDLTSHYTQLLEADPSNRDLAYLLGRLYDDPQASLRMMQRAVQPPGSSAHAHHAIAWYYTNRGQFEEALDFEQKALRIMPDKSAFRLLEEELLLATGKHDELIARRRSEIAANHRDQDTALSLNSLFALTGRKEESKQLTSAYLESLKGLDGYSEEYAARITALFEATYAQGERDSKSFARHSERIGEGEWLYYAAVVNRDLTKAADILSKTQSSSYLENLLLYVLAMQDGRAAFAGVHLKEAINALEKGSVRERQAALWFGESGTAPALYEVYKLGTWPRDTRILLTALGARFPRMKDVYFTSARKMNYDPAFPGIVLDSILTDAAASASARYP